jgi:hypothetical protein
MGTISTLKFFFGVGFASVGILFAAFFAYMSIFGKRSTLRQKTMSETDESI